MRKLTQEQLALKMGIGREYVQLIEAGKARPSPEICIGLPLALEVARDELYRGEPATLAEWRRIREEDKSE